MNKRQTVITYPFETTLTIKEELLSSIRVCLLVTPKAGDTLHSYGLTHHNSPGYFPELENNFIILSFKKISKESSPEKYKIYFNISLYIETDTTNLSTDSFYGNPTDLMVIIHYINNRGQYESRKYKI